MATTASGRPTPPVSLTVRAMLTTCDLSPSTRASQSSGGAKLAQVWHFNSRNRVLCLHYLLLDAFLTCATLVGPTYVLRSWPAGYQMFDHNKGPASAPRHDAYLMGMSSRLPLSYPSSEHFAQVHVTPSGSVQSPSLFLTLSGCSRTRPSLVPTVAANTATKSLSAKSPRLWVCCLDDLHRCLPLQHHVKSLESPLPTQPPPPQLRLRRLAQLVNEPSRMQLSVVFHAQ